MAKSAAPLIIAAGAGFLLMGGKKKKKSSKKKCPPVVHLSTDLIPSENVSVEYEDGTHGQISMSKVAYREAVGGNRDLIDITKKVLAPFLPETCVSSESIKIILSENGKKVNYTAVEFFYMLSAELLEDFQEAGLFNHDESKFSANEVMKWWVAHMGEAPLPMI